MTETVAGYRVRRRALGPLFVFEIDEEERLLDAAADDDRICPYGAVAWESGLVAARAILARAQPTAVVDVGCGVGPVALAFAAAGCRALALDKDPNARALTAAAAAAQGLEVEVGALDLDDDAPLPRVDDALYVFADVLYEPTLAARVAHHALALAARGDRVVVVDPGRYSRAVFLERARLPAEAFAAIDDDQGGGLAWCWLPSA